MNERRQWIWFAAVAVAVVGLGYLSWSRLGPAPLARPQPNSKWTSATTEPDVRVYMSDSGTITTMKFEKYIEGVVAAEVEPTWPLEALKAQAIVARSLTVWELENSGGVAKLHPGADVSTNFEEFQAYNASRVNDNIRRAVQETRGQIVVWQNRPAWALFCADSGGQTAKLDEGGFTPPAGTDTPYLRNVSVKWTAPNPNWTATFSLEEVRAAAARAGRDPGAVTSVTIATKGPSGRALDLKIGNATVPAPKFRLAIGSTRMKSTWLTSVAIEGDKVTFKGKGYGHGVGMSQWGAQGMASAGRSNRDIIAYFYPGARIAKIWP